MVVRLNATFQWKNTLQLYSSPLNSTPFYSTLLFSTLPQFILIYTLKTRRRTDVIIKPADEGGAVVVWARPLYIQEDKKTAF